MTFNQYESINTRAISPANELFSTIVEQTVDKIYPLYLAIVQREQQKELRNINIKLRAYMWDCIYG